MVPDRSSLPKKEPIDDYDVPRCAKGTMLLTYEMWYAIERRAKKERRSDSWMTRELIGEALGIPPERRQPPPQGRVRRDDDGE